KAKTGVVAIRPPLEETMTQSRLPDLKRPTRRQVLKSAALGSAAAIAAPYVRGVSAAASLSLAAWAPGVSGATNTLTKPCSAGREDQLRGQNRLHDLAGREGEAHRGCGGASRYRPRHYVPPGLEHPHSPERA